VPGQSSPRTEITRASFLFLGFNLRRYARERRPVHPFGPPDRISELAIGSESATKFNGLIERAIARGLANVEFVPHDRGFRLPINHCGLKGLFCGWGVTNERY
jgi:hypothetical protein